MRTGGRFQRSFFSRPCLAVAPDLLGAYLVHRLPDGTRRAGRIVEVEAYLGEGEDPGSHAFRGETPRNRAMFGPPGRLYVYRSYGIHTCANVVCEAAGRGAAVLLRALEPVSGTERMQRARRLRPGMTEHELANGPGMPEHELANGPGKLCQALGITLADYGTSLLEGPLSLRRPRASDSVPRIARSQRIGLSRGRERRYRFYVPKSPFVSRTRPG